MKEVFDENLLNSADWSVHVLGAYEEGTNSVDELCSSMPTFEPKDDLSTKFTGSLIL